MHLRDLQAHAAKTCRTVFGNANMESPLERDLRFAEEAFELLFARGLPFSKVMELLVHEYFTKPQMGKPAGEVPQEIAGTMVTLLNLSSVNDICAESVTINELQRILTNRDKIRAKHDLKPNIAVRCGQDAA